MQQDDSDTPVKTAATPETQQQPVSGQASNSFIGGPNNTGSYYSPSWDDMESPARAPSPSELPMPLQ
jgi:hypothetical protein